MTLRIRLLAAFALVLAIVVTGAVLVIRTQASYLTEQIDRQLMTSLGPILRAPGPLFQDAHPPRALPAPGETGEEPPISDLFLAIEEDGRLRPIVLGQLLADVPAVTVAEASSAILAEGVPFTAEGAEGRSRFRVIVARPDDGAPMAVIALPLDAVDEAVDRLTLTLLVGILVIAVVLGVIVFWVERLGLRPIERLTSTAEAIAGGDRTTRAAGADRRTEAGKLAAAFNVMLDERDQGEARLRRFVADASHELRTPLTGIRGYLELLRDGGGDDAERADMLRRMAQESARMGALVEDLLLLARLDEHRPLRAEQVDLRRILEDAAADARVVQPDRPIAVQVPDGEAPLITGDPHRVEQVVSALVDNALTHTDRAVPLLLAARIAGDHAVLTVEDSGPGMAPEVAARAFDRFVRGDESRSRKAGGSGLGLAIAKAIVEAHGGTIALRTAPGEGCTVSVSLPR